MAAKLSRAAVDRDHVADGRAAVADARVERAEGELEAAAVALLDAGDERVEAPALAVDLDDVALRDALRGEPLRGGRRAAGRRGEEARLPPRAPGARAAPGRGGGRGGSPVGSIAPATLARRRDGAATASHTRRCSATFAARSVRTCSS